MRCPHCLTLNPQTQRPQEMPLCSTSALSKSSVNGLLNLKMNPPKWCGSDFQTGRYNCALKPRDLWALKEEKKNETDLLSCVVAVPAPGAAGDPGLPRKGRQGSWYLYPRLFPLIHKCKHNSQGGCQTTVTLFEEFSQH